VVPAGRVLSSGLLRARSHAQSLDEVMLRIRDLARFLHSGVRHL